MQVGVVKHELKHVRWQLSCTLRHGSQSLNLRKETGGLRFRGNACEFEFKRIDVDSSEALRTFAKFTAIRDSQPELRARNWRC